MRMTEGFAFFPLNFDEDGELENPAELDAMIGRANGAPKATDAIVLAHGFRNDANDATVLYGGFLKTFAANLDFNIAFNAESELPGDRMAVILLYFGMTGFIYERLTLPDVAAMTDLDEFIEVLVTRAIG